MATKVKHKRSSISGNKPNITQLESGELALNTADGKVFLLRDDNTVQDITQRIFENDTEIRVDDSGDSSGSITININGDEKFTATNASFNFNNDVDIQDGQKLTFRELTASGADGISLKAPDTLEAGYDLTLPGQNGTVGQLIRTNGSGQLEFVDADFFGGNVIYVSAEKGNDANDGVNAPVLTVKRACQLASALVYNADGSLTNRRVNIKVAVGDYTEQNPIIVPDNTVIKGDGLRGCIIRPANANEDMLRVRNACYFGEFTFRDGVDSNFVPTITADYAVAFDDPTDETVSRVGYTNLPTSRPTITTSPYIQNCSILSFLGMNGAKIDGSKVATPNVPLNAIEAENPVIGAVPQQGKSMVANAFTMLSFGGTGWRLLNDAYAQIVSCFEIFMLNGVYCQSGGYCSITNSATNFGLYALRSSGYSPKAFEFDRGYVVATGQSEGQQTLRIVGIQRDAPVEEFVLRFREPDYKIAYDLIEMETDNLAADLITYINNQISAATPSIYAGFTYAEDEAFRDIQTLSDAVRFDALFNGNYRSINAALAMLRGSEPGLFGTNTTVTVDALGQAKTFFVARLTDATAISRANALWDEIIDIITNGDENTVPGDAVADAYSIPDPTGYNTSYLTNYGDARQQLTNNRTFIIEEMLAWTAEQVADEISPFSSAYVYNPTLLEKEMGYVLDALRYDLTYGGNLETFLAAKAYFTTESLDTASQKLGHIALLERLQDIIVDIVQELPVTKTAANPESQDTSGTATTLSVANIVSSRIQNIIDYVDTGNDFSKTKPGTSWVGNATLVEQFTGTMDDAELIQVAQDVIAYINNEVQTNIWYNFTYDNAKCERDAKLILDAVKKDTWATGNTYTRGAGLSYYFRNLQDSSQITIAGQELQTIAAIDQLAVLTNTMLNGYGVGTDARDFVGTRFDIITTIINDPDDLPDPRDVTSEGDITNNYKTTPTAVNFNGATEVTANTDVFSITGHGFLNGQQVIYTANGNTPIPGLDEEQTYYVVFINNNEFTLAYDDSLTFAVDVKGTSTGTHQFLTNVKEFFVDEITESHQTYQKLILESAASTAEFVPGRAITGITGVTPNSAYVYSWKPDTRELIVSIEQVLVGSSLLRVQFDSSSTIDEDHAGTPATNLNVDSVAPVTNLGTADFTITATSEGEQLTNLVNLLEKQVWFHRPSVVNSSAHTWEYAGSGTDYNALPQNGGNTRAEYEQFEELPGRVYSSGTNELGDFKVGDFITAFNRTGNITFRNKVQVDELDALKLSVSDVSIEEISTSVNLGDDELGGPSDARLSTQLAIRSFLSNRLGQFIDKAVSTSAVPGAIIQLNSNGQINAELIPAQRSFLNANGQGYRSRLEFVEDIPALDLSAGDIGTETYEQQELTLSGNATWSDGDVVTQAGRPNAIGYAKGDGNNTNILIVASQGGEWIEGDDSTGSEWIAGSGYNISIDGSDTGFYVTSLGGSAEQTDNYFLRTSNSSQYLILDVASAPTVTNTTITNVERTSNVSTYTTTVAHDLNVGSSVRVVCTTDPTYTISTRVLSVPSTTTFTAANEGSDESSKAASGTCQTTLTSADSNSQGAVTDLRMGVCLNVDNTNITSGSGYAPVSGTLVYEDVPLTNVSSSGSGARANITVTAGAITDVDLIRGGTGYAIGDTLSAADSDLGNNGGANFSIEILSVEDRLYVDILGGELFVASASSIDYAEDNDAVLSKDTITLTDTISHNFLAGTIAGGGQVDYTDSEITITSHGLTNGDPVTYTTLGNVAIGNLENNKVYYVGVIDSDTIELYADFALVTKKSFTSTPANNNHNLTRYTVNLTDNSLLVPAHGLSTGDAIRIEGSDLFEINAEQIDSGERFFIGSVTTNSFTIHPLRSDALASINGLVTNARDITANGTGTADIIPQNLRINEVVNTSSRVADNWSSLAVTNIDAENIVSGTISPTRLASSGVANTETFLRGDSTYAEVVQHLIVANTTDNPITLTGLNVGGEFYEDVSIGIANVDYDAGGTFSTLGTSRFLQSQFNVNEDGSGEVFIKDGVVDAGTLDNLDSSYFLNPANLTSAVPVSRGGTNLTTYATGDLLYASSSGVLTTLPVGIPGSFLSVNDAGNAPEWNTAIFIEEGLDLGSARITSSSTGNGQLYPNNITSLYMGLDSENIKIGKRTTSRDITSFIKSFEANNVTDVAVNLSTTTKTTGVDAANDSNYIQLSNTTDLIPGMIVTGSGIAANTTITGISGDYIFISNNTTGTISSGATLTFSNTPEVLGIESGDSIVISGSQVTNLDGTWYISGATFNATSFTVRTENAVSALASTPLAGGLSVVRDNTIVIKNENLILGGAEASTSPNAGNIKGESGIGNNTGGASVTIEAGLGTGNATGGDFVVKTGEVTTSGSAQQASTTRLTIDTSGKAAFTGEVEVNNNISTTEASVSLLDDTATTVNAFGAATLVDIGAATGTTNINNNLDVDLDVNVDGGDITTNQTTFNLINTNATTLNIGGAATAVSVGAGTGTTTVNHKLVVAGDLEVQGSTTTLDTATLAVEDKNIEIAKVTTPTDDTADGAGITIKGATDKLITWNKNTDYFTVNQDWNLTSGKEYYINDVSVLSSTTLGSGVTNSSLTSVGTIGTGTWQGSVIGGTYGGTGVNNGTKTITLGGSLTTSGAFDSTFTMTAATSVTFPTSGTLASTSNNLGVFAATTSAQLAGVISDETGSGALVFGTSPNFTTSVTTGSTTFAVFNTTATTVNAFGAATTIEIGADTQTVPGTYDGTTNINHNLTVDGDTSLRQTSFNEQDIVNVGTIDLDTIAADNGTDMNFASDTIVNIDNVTQSTSTATGALIIDGGVGIAKNLHVGGATNTVGLNSTGTVYLAQNQVITFEGSGDDANETTLTVANPTADRTITLPNKSGTVALTSDLDFDKYVSWTAKDGDTTEYTVTSGDVLTFAEGTGMDVDFTADDVLTFTNTDRGSAQNIFKTFTAQQSDGTARGSIVADSNADTMIIRENGAITLGVDATNDILTIAHADTSTITGAQGSAGIASITIDGYGHVTAVTTATYDNYSSWTMMEGNGTETSTVGSGQTAHFEQGTGMQIELTAARQLTFTNTDRGSSQNIFKNVTMEQPDGTDIGTVTADANNDTLFIRETQVDSTDGIVFAVDNSNGADILKIGHADTSSVSNVSVDNSNGNVLQDISFTFDTYGHVTAASVASVNLDTRYVNVTGDTMTGLLTIDMADSNEKLRLKGDANDSPYLSFYQDTTRGAFIQFLDSDNTLRLVNDISDEEVRLGSGINGLKFINGGTTYTVYHSGNFAESDTLQTVTTRGNTTSNTVQITNTTASTSTTTGALTVAGGVGVGGTLSAVTKSFVIDHPTKEGMKLRHGSLEGPEDGVYVRGRLKDSNVIELPDYWTGLVHEDTITVNLTAIGGKQDIWVEDIVDNTVVVGSEFSSINCFYTVYAERKDVDRWDTEYEE